MTKYSEETKNKILELATIKDVAEDFAPLQAAGASFIQECPQCANKKLYITPGKKLFHCFICEIGGNNALSYLIKAKGMGYHDAMKHLADKYGIIEEAKKNGKQSRRRDIPFVDSQLHASGIPKSAIQFERKVGSKTFEDLFRYEPGTVDKAFEIIPTGDDMIIHYLDFDWSPMKYRTPQGKEKPFYRVRYSNPNLHKDKDGNPTKYRSPYKGGNQLYLPNHIIKAVAKNEIIETLVVCEGEKKADKLCVHGISAVGIAGIHNFSMADQMPFQFQKIIHNCGVKNVVFLLDSDWQDLKPKSGKSVDQRPRTFCSAVIKFKDYFYQFNSEGYDLDLFFGSHKDNIQKGIDDLLVYSLKGKEQELLDDLNGAINKRDKEGEHLTLHKITTATDYKIQEFWNIHSYPAFIDKNRETLKKLKSFKLGRIQYRWNEETDTIENAQPLQPKEHFWKVEEWEGRNGKIRKRYTFSYQGARVFLRNRGFGKLKLSSDAHRLIQVDKKVVREVSPQDIQDYMLEFTESINEREVLEMILSGGFRYFGDKALQAMYQKKPEFMEPTKGVKYFVFKNGAWKITADEIKEVTLAELPGYVWENQMIDFEPTLFDKPLFTVEHNKEATYKWMVKSTEQYAKSDVAQYVERSSWFSWRTQFEVKQTKEGQEYTVERQIKDPMTQKDKDEWIRNTVSKMMATGYVLNDYKDRSNMRAIVAMDGVESEVGASQGGTGKSIWGTMFEHITNIFVIDAKSPKLTEDQFLYEGVDERTKVITFDDCRVNLDFEAFLSQITRGLTVNGKGVKKYTLTPPPQFIFLTNHAIKGDDNSTLRRQYLISFSDYYNAWRTPKDDFGHLMFYEWDFEQWNLFFNYMAACVQTYMKYGLKKVINDGDLKRRKLRQRIGEDLLEWMDLKFDKEHGVRNKLCDKSTMHRAFTDDYPQQRKYISLRKFKQLVKAYCDYAGLEFNPTKNGGDFKKNGTEYFVLADDQFDAADIETGTEASF